MNTAKITVEATIASDRTRVWKLYTDPAHITKWNFASDDWHCPNAENDLRVGGTYRARMEAKDGSYGFDFEAIYNEVVPQEKFTYTLTDGRKASVYFESRDNQTLVTITFDPEHENPIQMQRDGWQAILNNFKSYTEGN